MDESEEIIEAFEGKYHVIETLTGIYNDAVKNGDGDSVLLLYQCVTRFAEALAEKLPGGRDAHVVDIPDKAKMS